MKLAQIALIAMAIALNGCGRAVVYDDRSFEANQTGIVMLEKMPTFWN
jgi:hypothetical protein